MKRRVVSITVIGEPPPGFRMRIYRCKGTAVSCEHDVPAAEAEALVQRLMNTDFDWEGTLGTIESENHPPVKTMAEIEAGRPDVHRSAMN